ncbi:hypothetical protein ABWK22_01565 [Gottfriedia acidiceleris]|uniref:hypothetical protein n=1 Tax=Gottfriedia acidiceleris TaxID=371036 RepID=UPI00339704FF
MQQLNQKLDSTEIFQTIMKETMIDDLITNLISYRTLHALKIKRSSFNDRGQYEEFLSNIHSFQRNLQHHFARYCQNNNQIVRLNKEQISIRGYYVENKDFGEALIGEELIILYAELKDLTNKDSVIGLYHWEDKFNELRISSDSSGLQRTSGD